MIARIIIFLLTGLLITFQTSAEEIDGDEVTHDDILYVNPDGTMEFNGSLVSKEDVVIYVDKKDHGRAGVKLIIPRHPNVYRDTIMVKRKESDMPNVENKKF